jgi:hypothetical protein
MDMKKILKHNIYGHGRWFSPGTPASPTTKTGRHDIAEILLKVTINTINQINQIISMICLVVLLVQATGKLYPLRLRVKCPLFFAGCESTPYW